MSLKIRKNCKVCEAVRKDPPLLRRIYKSKAYVKGGESLRAIHEDYTAIFRYEALWNHTKKHQNVSEQDLMDSRLKYHSRAEELKLLQQAIDHNAARQELVDLGMDEVRAGHVKMNSSTLATLLKQQSDIEQKEKDRQIDVLKMVQRFQAGELSYNEENPSGLPATT